MEGYDNNYHNIITIGNTHRKMIETTGGDVPLMSEATAVTTGTAHLIESQEKGFAHFLKQGTSGP